MRITYQYLLCSTREHPIHNLATFFFTGQSAAGEH